VDKIVAKKVIKGNKSENYIVEWGAGGYSDECAFLSPPFDSVSSAVGRTFASANSAATKNAFANTHKSASHKADEALI
jgi:hypothetical protein